jgi:hypothetical protein
MLLAMANVGVRVAAAIFALTWLVLPGFGVIDLSVTWNADWPVMLEAGWGLLFSGLVGAAFLAIAVSPRRAAAPITQLLAVTAALALSAVLSDEWRLLTLAAAVGLETAGLWLAAGRVPLRPHRAALSRPLAALAMVGAVPWLLYAVTMYRANRQGAAIDITLGINHYAVQGALALALVILAGLASEWPHLRRLTGTLIGLVAIYLGTVSLFWQGTLAGYDKGWSALTVAWGAGIAALSVLSRANPTNSQA